jgi:branched-chain amino acid transport system substrate-binding protein
VIAAGPYFRGETGWPGPGQFGSSHEAAAWRAVQDLAGLLAHRPGAEEESLAALLAARRSSIDAQTHHTTLPALIAQVRGGAFRVLARCGQVAGDPYLTARRPEMRAVSAPVLRVVS